MEFLSAKQISSENLERIEYDIFILAAGYEHRSIYLPQNFNIRAKRKIALAFHEKSKELNRKANDAFLIQAGFSFISLSGDQMLELNDIFSDLNQNSVAKNLIVLIDYSSMTKIWYAGIINYLISQTKTCDYVTVHFSYTPALYSDLKRSVPVKFNQSVSYSNKKAIESTKPTALIIGLGLEKSHAEFIHTTVNPDLTLLIYADPSNDLKYVEKVFKNNRDLIEKTEVRNLISFPLNNLDKTNDILTGICLNLRAKYNIIIAPVGPKILSLLALLLSSRYPDINVLRVSSGNKASVFDRIPCSDPLIFSAEFVSDELDI